MKESHIKVIEEEDNYANYVRLRTDPEGKKRFDKIQKQYSEMADVCYEYWFHVEYGEEESDSHFNDDIMELIEEVHLLEKDYNLPNEYLSSDFAMLFPPHIALSGYEGKAEIKKMASELFALLKKTDPLNATPFIVHEDEWDKPLSEKDTESRKVKYIQKEREIEIFKDCHIYEGQRRKKIVLEIDVFENLEKVLIPAFKGYIKNSRTDFISPPKERRSGKKHIQCELFLIIEQKKEAGDELHDILLSEELLVKYPEEYKEKLHKTKRKKGNKGKDVLRDTLANAVQWVIENYFKGYEIITGKRPGKEILKEMNQARMKALGIDLKKHESIDETSIYNKLVLEEMDKLEIDFHDPDDEYLSD